MFFLLRSVFWLGLVFSAMDWPQNGGFASDVHQMAAPAAARSRDAIAEKIQRTCLDSMTDCIEGAARINKLATDLADQKAATVAALRAAPANIDALLAQDLELVRKEQAATLMSLEPPRPADPPLPVARPKTLGR
jgi:hypothetical protein